jgi:hypothetical protein
MVWSLDNVQRGLIEGNTMFLCAQKLDRVNSINCFIIIIIIFFAVVPSGLWYLVS